ncbi:MAG: helix-turn-helix domain-containing protein [Bacteroidales bacterium]|nr:helix-turn-helix domain-containing protein [Bacteroidales bacterium]
MEQQQVSHYCTHPIWNVILAKVTALEEKLDHFQPVMQVESVQWLNISELIDYLPNHPAEQTVYGWTSARKIPFHKQGKSIMFKKSEIDAWLEGSTYRKSKKDLQEEAEAFVNGKRR